MSFKCHFRRFLDAEPARLHVAAHSHHLWPDVTFDAQMQCWRDAARLADRKWDLVFGDLIPALRQRLAAILGLSDPATLAFAPNTHDFVGRLLSCLPADRPVRVLTTDSEFHSFERQIKRLEEDGSAVVTRVPTRPFADFPTRFAQAAARGGYDLVFFSQVFFNSGYAVPRPADLVDAVVDDDALVVIDGYHAFMAVPTDLEAVRDRAFYIAGGYKYAMAGEGACFMHAPPGYGARPRNTGWFAAFGALESGAGGDQVPYSADGSRFMGATFDPVGLYRMKAVLDWLADIGLDVAGIHDHVCRLQIRLLVGVRSRAPAALRDVRVLASPEDGLCGHFLTFETDHAAAIHERLLAADVVTDYRGDRLRFGLGLYHDDGDIERLLGELDRIEGARRA